MVGHAPPGWQQPLPYRNTMLLNLLHEHALANILNCDFVEYTTDTTFLRTSGPSPRFGHGGWYVTKGKAV